MTTAQKGTHISLHSMVVSEQQICCWLTSHVLQLLSLCDLGHSIQAHGAGDSVNPAHSHMETYSMFTTLSPPTKAWVWLGCCCMLTMPSPQLPLRPLVGSITLPRGIRRCMTMENCFGPEAAQGSRTVDIACLASALVTSNYIVKGSSSHYLTIISLYTWYACTWSHSRPWGCQ